MVYRIRKYSKVFENKFQDIHKVYKRKKHSEEMNLQSAS